MSQDKVLNAISHCNDLKLLKNWIKNAQKSSNKTIENAAFNRLIEIAPTKQLQSKENYTTGSVEHDFWKTIYAFEEILTQEAGKTRRLTRTRQKTQRVGEIAMIREWATSPKQSAGFIMLAKFNRPDLLGEAIAIRHPEIFTNEEIELAKQKIIAAGFEIETCHIN